MKLVRINEDKDDTILVGKYKLPEDFGEDTKFTYGATSNDSDDIVRIENTGHTYVETGKLNLEVEVVIEPGDFSDKYTLVFNKKYDEYLSEKLVKSAHDDFDDATGTFQDILEEGLSVFRDESIDRTSDKFDEIIEESVKEFFNEMKGFTKVSFE